MGIVQSITHFILKNGITALIIMGLAWFWIDLPPTKLGPFALICLIGSAVGSVIASLLLAKHWGN